jgi:2-C-methyl-D-erythritol 4-phosphate cytidylyltransferase
VTATPPGAAAIVLAGGSGSRLGADQNKVLLPLAGVPVLAHSVVTAFSVPDVTVVVVVAREGEQDAVRRALAPYLGEREVRLVVGGDTRHVSEWEGVLAVAPDIERGEVDVVAIHDAARPLAPVELWTATLAKARAYGGAIPVVPLTGLARTDGAPLAERLCGVQTPQAFRARELLAAHRAAAAEGYLATDTAGCLERHGVVEIAAVPSTTGNLKITFAEDLSLAERLLPARSAPPAR